MTILFPKKDQIKRVRICPKCGSQNVQTSKLSYLGDPLKIEGMVGWDCLDCKYTGKAFVLVDEEDAKIYKKFKVKK